MQGVSQRADGIYYCMSRKAAIVAHLHQQSQRLADATASSKDRHFARRQARGRSGETASGGGHRILRSTEQGVHLATGCGVRAKESNSASGGSGEARHFPLAAEMTTQSALRRAVAATKNKPVLKGRSDGIGNTFTSSRDVGISHLYAACLPRYSPAVAHEGRTNLVLLI